MNHPRICLFVFDTPDLYLYLGFVLRICCCIWHFNSQICICICQIDFFSLNTQGDQERLDTHRASRKEGIQHTWRMYGAQYVSGGNAGHHHKDPSAESMRRVLLRAHVPAHPARSSAAAGAVFAS